MVLRLFFAFQESSRCGCSLPSAPEAGLQQPSRAWGFPSADSDYDISFIVC
ncbi:MAG: DNA polymerase beta superfamily protein [Syntrophales bacterium]